MRRWLNLLLLCAIGICFLPLSSIQVQAKDKYENYYVMSCSGNQYEVDVVNDSGYFDMKGCYAGFAEAKAAMKSWGNDAVVRHAESFSPSKIIAMTRGVAYSFPNRNGGVTLTIQGAAGTSTYMSAYRQLDYWDTQAYYGDGTGDVYATVTGFDGNVNLRDIDLIPQKFISYNLPIYLGGNDNTSEHSAPFYVRPRRAYYTVRQNGNYRDLIFVAYSSYAEGGSIPRTVAEIAVGPAASWMTTGASYYSYDDVRYYTDPYYSYLAGTYFNYYQFLPLRTKSNITADKYNGFLASKGYGTNSVLWDSGQYFIDAQNTYGVNAVMIFAQACLEAAYGTSYFAKQRYNLFGWNAVDSDPNRASYYSSVAQSINEQMGIQLRNGYLSTRNRFSYYGSFFGNKGSGLSVKYASTPYYGVSIAAIAYSFDKYASGNDGYLVDYGSAKVGYIVGDNINVYQSLTSSTVLYNSSYASGYNKFHFVNVLGESGGYYKIQSTNHVVNGQSMYTAGNSSLATYDWNASVGWVSNQNISFISVEPLTKQVGKGAWVKDYYGYWYRHFDGTYTRSDWELIDGYWYYFDEQGYRKTGFLTLGTKKYYLDETSGIMAIGFAKVNGKIYHFDAYGAMSGGWFQVNNEWYWANDDGSLKIGWHEYSGRNYYFDDSGMMKKGWVYTNNNYQYLNAFGFQVFGWLKEGDINYYLDTNGNMVKGVADIEGKKYYFNGSGAMQTGWIDAKPGWYWANDDGSLKLGWQVYANRNYYFDENGKMQTGWVKTNNQYQYLNDFGIQQFNWILVDGVDYYLGTDGNRKTGWIQYLDRNYYLDENGKMKKGWVYTNNQYQYLNDFGIQQFNWIVVNGKDYYLGVDGNMKVGWVYYGNYYYYLDENGLITKGWKLINGSWYYLDSFGHMLTGWQKINGYWYYLGEETDGSMKTGTISIGGRYYTFNNGGVLVS